MRFQDRAHAGGLLATRLMHLRDARPVVVALPRGGVPVAAAVAAALGAPLDVLVVRKLGAPAQPELAVGAIGEDGLVVRNDHILEHLGLAIDALDEVIERERAEVERRRALYRAARPHTPLRDRTVIVVDDGLATGASARAALAVVRAHGPRRVVLAVPVAAPESLLAIGAGAGAGEIIALTIPVEFRAVGAFYSDFRQVSDDEVARLLDGGAGD